MSIYKKFKGRVIRKAKKEEDKERNEKRREENKREEKRRKGKKGEERKRKEKRREGKRGIILSVRKDLEKQDESCKAETSLKRKRL